MPSGAGALFCAIEISNIPKNNPKRESKEDSDE